MASIVSINQAAMKASPARAIPVNTDAKTCHNCDKNFVWFFPTSRRKAYCELCGRPCCAGCLRKDMIHGGSFNICGHCETSFVQELRGLTAFPWFHGKICRDEAERRLRAQTSALGDFLVRVMSDPDHAHIRSKDKELLHEHIVCMQYVISIRDTPGSVAHLPIRGKEGEFYLDRTATFSSVEALVESKLETDLIDRAAIVEEGSITTCPTCSSPFDLLYNNLFCSCGARLASTPQDRAEFDRIGFELLHADTTA